MNTQGREIIHSPHYAEIMAAKRAEVAIREQMLGDEYGSQVRRAIEYVMMRRFGRATREGEPQYPHANRPFVGWPALVIVPVSIHHLYQGVRVENLRHDDTLRAIAGRLAEANIPFFRVTQVDSIPSQNGQRDNGSVFYVVVRQPLPALPAPADEAATVKLPKRVELDMATRPPGEYMVPIGMTAGSDGQPVVRWESLDDMIHVVVTGESGGGKSTLLSAWMCALLSTETPERLRVALVSNKRSQFAVWENAPHLWDAKRPVAIDGEQVGDLLRSLLDEWQKRDVAFCSLGVKDLRGYNSIAAKSGRKSFPVIWLVVDEALDLALEVGPKSRVMDDLARVMSKGRSHGFRVTLASTKVKWDILDTRIVAHADDRIAFRMPTPESARAFQCPGADGLPADVPGRAVARIGSRLIYVQTCLVSDEVEAAIAARVSGQVVGHVRQTASIEMMTPAQAALVVYAVERLDRWFSPDELSAVFGGDVTGHRLRRLAVDWERRGWLERAKKPNKKGRGSTWSRRVTNALVAEAARTAGKGDAVGAGDAGGGETSAVDRFVVAGADAPSAVA